MALHKLTKKTVQLISSSQVITSVHSIVKELVENSLDAKSSNIEIKLENYGLDFIHVRDNGTGVTKSDVPSMASPHCTSKLSSFQDLLSLNSYGFRGEALASIAVLADLSITTATKEDDLAHTYMFNHSGELVSTKPSSLGSGTTVAISNLFKNMPVRKKVYKSSKHCRDDLKKVELVLLAFGLAYPNCRFSLKHNKMSIWEKERTTDFKYNLALVLGSGVAQNIMPVNYQCFSPMVKLQVYVPKPSADVSVVSRAKPDRLFVLVNMRPVEIKVISKLLKDVFSEAFPSQSGRYPVAMVNISVLPEDVDVNLEPNKTTVLLHSIDFIADTLTSLLTQAYGPCKVKEETSKRNLKQKEPTSPDRSSSLKNVGSSTVEDQVSTTRGVQCAEANTVTDTTVANYLIRAQTLGNDTLEVPRDIIGESNDLEEDYSALDLDELEQEFSDTEQSVTCSSPRDKERDTISTSPATVVSSDREPITKQVSLLSWSRGEAITDAMNRPVEPVKVICPTSIPSTVPHQRALVTPKLAANQSKLTFNRSSHGLDTTDSHSVKRRIDDLSTSPEDQQINKRVKQQSSGSLSLDCSIEQCHQGPQQQTVGSVKEPEVPSITVEYALKDISQRNKALLERLPPLKLVDHVVGSCQFLPGSGDPWIVLLDSKLASFDINRVLRTNQLLVISKTDVEKAFMDVLQEDGYQHRLTSSCDQYFHEIYSLKDKHVDSNITP